MDPAETITTTAATVITAATGGSQALPSSTIALVGQPVELQGNDGMNNDSEDDFPVRVTRLPNKGRSFVATRNIQPQELVFVAEAFGTTMCDPWLDCGICHYCWADIRDRKAQIRLPSFTSTTAMKQGKQGKGRKQETTMVFCDETCWKTYGPDVADMICRVEGKIRRTWADSGARLWKLRTEERRSPCKGISTNNFGPDTPSTSSSPSVASAATIAPHYSELIRQALASADTKHRILGLNNTELSRFLDITWSAFDGLISEQESWIQYTTTDSTPYNPAHPRSHSHTQAQCEALYPKLAKHLLEGNNHATIAAKTSDDDCEMIRLISEILYRQQLDLEAAGATSMTGHSSGAGEATSVHGRQKATKAPAAAAQAPSTKTSSLRGGRRATFEDYYAMQSNELVLFRQQIKEDLDAMEEQEEESEQDSEDEQEQDAIQDIQSEQQQQQQLPSRESKHDTDMAQWRQLLSILPKHLLSCFYVYLRIRDAYLLLARENATLVTANPDTPHAAPHQQQQQRPTITLQITSTLFRALLYREVANSFGIRDASDELLGFAVFPRACFFNHSCRPNILKKRRLGCKARQMEYWSTEFIQKGEECCISYGDILVGVEERRARLEDMYFFECSCPRCLEEAEK